MDIKDASVGPQRGDSLAELNSWAVVTKWLQEADETLH